MNLHLSIEETLSLPIHRIGSRWMPVERLRAQQDADAIRERAQEEAQTLRKDSKRKAEEEGQAIAKEWCRKGYRVGQQVGFRRIAAFVLAAQRTQTEALAAQSSELMALAVQMSQRILRRELALHPESVAEICRQVLAENLPSRHVLIRVHPEDLPYVKEGLGDRGLESELRFEVDPQIERGGCRMLTEHGQVDAQPSVQLEVIREMAYGQVSNAQPS